jgi:hypothetical protein
MTFVPHIMPNILRHTTDYVTNDLFPSNDPSRTQCCDVIHTPCVSTVSIGTINLQGWLSLFYFESTHWLYHEPNCSLTSNWLCNEPNCSLTSTFGLLAYDLTPNLCTGIATSPVAPLMVCWQQASPSNLL